MVAFQRVGRTCCLLELIEIWCAIGGLFGCFEDGL
jgi:hypothetical protein